MPAGTSPGSAPRARRTRVSAATGSCDTATEPTAAARTRVTCCPTPAGAAAARTGVAAVAPNMPCGTAAAETRARVPARARGSTAATAATAT
ncbi:MAG TPA: hypothetical protein VN714_26015, partial [Trebonia sp.]|nr:hypothetical protein [Trebonia sp.]